MKTVKLGDVCNLMTGGTPSRAHKEYFESGDIKWLVSGDIHKGAIYDCDGRITKDGLKNSNARMLPLNSVMIALNGQGKTRATVAMLRTEATCNQSLVSIYPKDDTKVLPEWIFWNLRGRYDELRRLTGDAGNERRGLNMIIIRNIDIPEPPSLEEQRRVVERLDAAFEKIDRAIELTEKNIKKTDVLFKSVLKQKIAQQKNGRQVTVGEMATIKGGKRIPKGHRLTTNRTDHPYIRVSDFDHRGGVDQSNLQFVPDALWRAISNYIITDQDVFLSIAGSIGITGIIPSSLNGANLTENACRLIPNSELNKDYLYFFTLSDSFIEQARGATRTTAQPKLALTRIKKIHFSLPDLESQLSIVSEIRKTKVETERLTEGYREKLKYLKALKQSLLTQAFSQSEVE